MTNNLTLTQEQVKAFLPIALKANIVPMITGSAGIGKSSIVQAVAKQFNLKLIDIRISQLMCYDLAGLISPNENRTKAGYLPVDTFPLDTDELPINPETNKPYDGFLLFLDEFNSGDRSTIAAAYKLILDRQIGKHNLHPNCRIVCAGNRIQDNAIVNKIGSAMQSRLVHIELQLNRKEFMEYVENSGWNTMLTAYFRYRPEMIHNFKPEEVDEIVTYACPRTWEFVNKLLENGLMDTDPVIASTVLCGTVGKPAGLDFVKYLEVYRDLPKIEEIEADPMNAPLPAKDNIGAKWAITAYLSDKFKPTNENALVTYIERLPEDDLKVLAYRMATTKYHALMKNKIVLQRLQGIIAKLKNNP